jgi:hypothetical protein
MDETLQNKLAQYCATYDHAALIDLLTKGQYSYNIAAIDYICSTLNADSIPHLYEVWRPALRHLLCRAVILHKRCEIIVDMAIVGIKVHQWTMLSYLLNANLVPYVRELCERHPLDWSNPSIWRSVNSVEILKIFLKYDTHRHYARHLSLPQLMMLLNAGVPLDTTVEYASAEFTQIVQIFTDMLSYRKTHIIESTQLPPDLVSIVMLY